ncbi:MAG: aminopeptidase [Candidatus Moraniibacteriota bacterium]
MLNKKKKYLILFSFIAVLILAFSSAIIGCENVSFFSQAIIGHFRIMRDRMPIEKIIADKSLDEDSLNKLRLILEVRSFASKELGLPENKSYTVYSNIKSQYAGWNIYVAPKFSIEPKKWCFPIAGCVVYRGYFVKDDALKFAKEEEKKGFDVFIGPFNAYSTLGWYDDPILSSHLRLNPIRLAGLIIHELAHQKLYIKGDSRFNEGFAVTVERAGVLQWLKSTGRNNEIPQALETWRQEDLCVEKILKARTELSNIYSSTSDAKILEEKKQSIFKKLKEDLCGIACVGVNLPKTDGNELKLNNAYLIPINTYYSLVPVFQNILNGVDGHLPLFFKKVKELGELPYQERQSKMKLLQKIK